MARFALIAVVDSDSDDPFVEVWEEVSGRLCPDDEGAEQLAYYLSHPVKVAELEEYEARPVAAAILTSPEYASDAPEGPPSTPEPTVAIVAGRIRVGIPGEKMYRWFPLEDPAEGKFTIRHSAGGRGEDAFGWWVGIGPATYGPYDDCDEREAIKRAHHDAGAGDPFAPSLAKRAAAAAFEIAEGVPRDDEWRSAASFIEHVCGILDRHGIERPKHYADEDSWR